MLIKTTSFDKTLEQDRITLWALIFKRHSSVGLKYSSEKIDGRKQFKHLSTQISHSTESPSPPILEALPLMLWFVN